VSTKPTAYPGMNTCLNDIVGRREPARPTPSQSAPADGIEDLLRAADLAALTPEQLNRLSRVLSAGLAGVSAEELGRRGLRRRDFWPSRGAPPTGGGRWVDHPSIAVDDRGRRVFVSEPYELDAVALRALVALADRGWQVTVHGRSTYFPGRTLQVRVHKPAADAEE
jgi:hypothetical protein